MTVLRLVHFSFQSLSDVHPTISPTASASLEQKDGTSISGNTTRKDGATAHNMYVCGTRTIRNLTIHADGIIMQDKSASMSWILWDN